MRANSKPWVGNVGVLASVALVVGVAVLAADKWFRYSYQDSGETRAQAIGQLLSASSVLNGFRAKVGRYPTTQAQAISLLFEEASIGTDPWEQRYVYRVSRNGERCSVFSLGADGIIGGSGVDSDLGFVLDVGGFEFVEGRMVDLESE